MPEPKDPFKDFFFRFNPERIVKNENQEQNVDQLLDREFRPKSLHPLSSQLPECVMDLKDFPRYVTVLQEYEILVRDLEEYNRLYPSERKSAFKSLDINIGWKFHLNVAPENVKTVSEYLLKNGYLHKFLSGGEVEDGKIFTIYIGSFALAKQLASLLSRDLEVLLARPHNHTEIEFASGIVGRFTGDRKKYRQYGSSGIAWLDEDGKLGLQLTRPDLSLEKKEEIRKILERKAIKALIEDYGDYFYPTKRQ